MAKKIICFGMGGTIAGRSSSPDDNIAYRAGQVDVADLLRDLPGLARLLDGRELLPLQVAQLDSKDMELSHWLALYVQLDAALRSDDVAGVVVTHGTDTVEETAYFLHRVLDAKLTRAKPVVLTCAMRPASSATPDGPANLLDAVAVACTPQAQGVLLVCAGKVHAAQHVQKVSPYRLDPFDSGEAGLLGVVEEGRVRMFCPWPPSSPVRADWGAAQWQAAVWPRVDIVLSHAGASGALVRSVCKDADAGPMPLRGLVVAGTGNGTIHAGLLAALEEAQAQGLHVVRVSRCPYGQIVAGPQDSGSQLPSLGLSPVKARIELMLALASATGAPTGGLAR